MLRYYLCYSTMKQQFIYEIFILVTILVIKLNQCCYAVQSDGHHYTSYCNQRNGDKIISNDGNIVE